MKVRVNLNTVTVAREADIIADNPGDMVAGNTNTAGMNRFDNG